AVLRGPRFGPAALAGDGRAAWPRRLAVGPGTSGATVPPLAGRGPPGAAVRPRGVGPQGPGGRAGETLRGPRRRFFPGHAVVGRAGGPAGRRRLSGSSAERTNRVGGFLARSDAATRSGFGSTSPEQDQQAPSGLPRLRSPALGLRDRPTPGGGASGNRPPGHPARRSPRFLSDRPRRRRPAGPAASAPRPRRGAGRGAQRSNGSPGG